VIAIVVELIKENVRQWLPAFRIRLEECYKLTIHGCLLLGIHFNVGTLVIIESRAWVGRII
jgi:hypothetical protein